MTVPLYWRDQSLMNWTATVLASSPEAIILDESAFFPALLLLPWVVERA
jgi:Ser-tRNA(Ala) deacylase AlaX